MRRRHHRSLEIRLLTIFIREINPVTCIHARLKLDAFAIHRNNLVAHNIFIRINTFTEEQIGKGETVNADIQQRSARKRRIPQALIMTELHREIRLDRFHIPDTPIANPSANSL